jgi:hypothetical protein
MMSIAYICMAGRGRSYEIEKKKKMDDQLFAR